MEIENIELKWLGHSSFLVKNAKVIYIDPYNINEGEKADIILITHDHFDHCSLADISKIVKPKTIVLTTAECQSKITKLDNIEMQIVESGDEITLGSIKILVVPAYNLNKEFHPKGDGVGFVVKMDKVIIYHAGDTDLIPEMEKLTGYGKTGNKFIALLPVGGEVTMNSEEAVKAASIIKPTLAIPMHYGSVKGTKQDADKFIELCKQEGISAEILEKS